MYRILKIEQVQAISFILGTAKSVQSLGSNIIFVFFTKIWTWSQSLATHNAQLTGKKLLAKIATKEQNPTVFVPV